MATSPTPSLDSIPGATHSIGSFGEHNDYLSDSPLTLSGSSPPVSDSAICDDFSSSGATSSLESHQATSSSASSTSSSSGLSCTSSNSAGVIGSGLLNSNQQQQQQQQAQQQQQPLQQLTGGVINITGTPAPRCTGCKSKQSDAVAKCIDCANYLCANCVTAHQFMHCFDGHNVFHINDGTNNNNNNSSNNSLLNGNTGTLDCLSSLANLSLNTNSISMLLQQQQQHQQQQQQQQQQQSQSQLSKLMGQQQNGGAFDGQSIKARFNYDSNDMLPKLTLNSLTNTNDLLSAALTNGLHNNSSAKLTSQYFCSKHKNELLKFFCRTCQVPICKECVMHDHPASLHECEHIQDSNPKQIEILLQTLTDLRTKVNELRGVVKNSEQNTQRIQMHYHKAQDEINETWQFFRSTLDERKQELLKELETFYNARSVSNSVLISKSQENVEKILQACDSVERFTKSTGINETIMLKKMLDGKMQVCNQLMQELQLNPDFAFISNYQAIQAGVRNTFGYIRSSDILPTVKQPPIARPTNGISVNGTNSNSNDRSLIPIPNLLTPMLDRQYSGGNSQLNGISNNSLTDRFDNNSIISKRFNSANSLGPFVSDVNLQLNPYEKWSNGGSDNMFQNITEQYQLGSNQNSQSANQITSSTSVLNVSSTSVLSVSQNATTAEAIIDLTSKLLSSSAFPPKSQIKRQKMIYHCKFGEFGVLEGQFTEPSGVAVNAQNDIVVADTNNHRIQIFDKEGRFKFQFGECGKRDGQLLYPNRVAVVKNSGDIVVTERSPTHQIQIYNQYGQFQRKFGANILQHPRGVTVDNKGRIIVVECKVMRVIIFDQYGVVLQKFGCSKHLEFPNGVVVNDKQEIFISDNRAHCVKVFNYEGQFLRQIGGEGITNYPIGVGINSAGEILIADNHNNFNLTIFTQDGTLVSALESKVKHAQCFDVSLMDDGSVVLASKDYRLYIYRYVQVPPIGL